MKRATYVAPGLRGWLLAVALAGLLCVHVSADLDLSTLAEKARNARVLVEVTFDAPLTAREVRGLRKQGLKPITPNTTALIGRDKLVFETQAGQAMKLQGAENVAEVRWIKQYPQAAHYHIYFEYAGETTAPELTFVIATPRSAAGRTLTGLDCFVWPETDFTTATDAAGNQFLTAKLTEVQPGQQVLFDFYATYEYDSEAIVEGSVAMLGDTPVPQVWPEEVQPFLEPGFHLESDAPEIVAVSEGLETGERLDERVQAALRYAGGHTKYDTEKRERYFGGRYVYNNSWEMWQGALGTLKRGMGCCPDTAELKVALLRATGIPARTAVHSGHLYAEIYVPELGWMTDAPMYNIPVLRATGPDNTAYFAWEPEVPVRCVEWGGRVQPFGQIRAGMTMDHPH